MNDASSPDSAVAETIRISRPVHLVTIPRPIAVGRFEVTFAEYDACLAAGGCRSNLSDRGWGRGPQPAIHATWTDAMDYTRWLSAISGKRYRLPVPCVGFSDRNEARLDPANTVLVGQSFLACFKTRQSNRKLDAFQRGKIRPCFCGLLKWFAVNDWLQCGG